MDVKDMIAAIEAHQSRVAKKRDEIRDLQSVASQLADDIDDAETEMANAVRALGDAADALSRLQ